MDKRTNPNALRTKMLRIEGDQSALMQKNESVVT